MFRLQLRHGCASLNKLRKMAVGFSRTVILRPAVGRRISRNDWNIHAVSRHFGEHLRERARMQQSSLTHSGRSFGQRRASG